MSNTKVSVIIPVYNASVYLRRCLDSVINQTYKNIEIICVNDGSRDDSGAICDEYALKDARVQVIHKENGGVSSARNAGLKAARGGYISFIDNDDYIESDYIERLFQNIEDIDAVACGLRYVQNDAEIKCYIPKSILYSTKQQIKDAYWNKEEAWKCFRSPFGKIYRRSVAEGIRFDEQVSGFEDILFNIQFLQRASNVKTIDYCGYNYYSNSSSITRQGVFRYNEHSDECMYLHTKLKEAALKSWGFSDEVLLEEKKKKNSEWYFYRVYNLVLPGTPFNKKQIRNEIKKIREEKEFVQPILDSSYTDLSLIGKIAKFNVQLNMPWLTENMFYCITRTRIGIAKSEGLKKWIYRTKTR